jgi:hypothetical protein
LVEQPLAEIRTLADADDLSFVVDPPPEEARALRPIIAYWERKRGSRAVPLRADIDPLELKEHLRQVFLVDALADGEFRFRLLGGEITERYGRNSTGKTVREAYSHMPEIAAWCTRMFQAVVTHKRPVLARGSLHAVRKEFFRFEAISLPLSREGIAVDMIFGAAHYTAKTAERR